MAYDSKHLAQYLSEAGIEAEIVHLQEHTPTVEAAAEAVGVHPEQIIKSLLFLADGKPVLVIANGFARVDYKKLATYLGISRRRIKLAKADEVLALTGYRAGAVPPFGHRQEVRTLVETAVFNQRDVYAGGGEINALMRMTVEELQRVVAGQAVELTKTDTAQGDTKD
jgi:Cys-tRNA(Pro) deacylase